MSADAADDPLWTSLPVPALVVDAADRILRINPAAEGFMLVSQRAVAGDPVWDRLAVDAPLEEAFERARQSGAPLFVNDVDIGTGARAPMLCNLQVAPLAGALGQMLILIAPRELAGRMAQKSGVKAAARSAIGMAEMLAHEIKNPLAGITGAAQLLSMNASAEDRELTDLNVGESRRIVGLLDRVEQFGKVVAGNKILVGHHRDLRVDGPQTLCHYRDLDITNGIGQCMDLAVSIGDADIVEVDQGDFTDTTARQSFRGPAAYATDTDHHNVGVAQQRQGRFAVKPGDTAKSLQIGFAKGRRKRHGGDPELHCAGSLRGESETV